MLPEWAGAGSIFRRWLFGFLIASVAIAFDPLGLSDAADRLSERLIFGLLAPLEGDRPGRDEITVVLVDDAFLAAVETSSGDKREVTWPLSRQDQYDRIVEPILERNPRALFLDWVWYGEDAPAPNGKDPDLADLVAYLDAWARTEKALSAPRLILADRPPRLCSEQEARRSLPDCIPPYEPKDLRGCAFRWTTAERLYKVSQAARPIGELTKNSARIERVPIRWWGREDRYPLAPLALTLETEKVPARCDPFGPANDLVPSAALAMFSHWCLRADGTREDHDLCRERPLRTRARVAGYALHRLPPALADALATPSTPFWLAGQSDLMRSIRAELGPDARDHPCMQRDREGAWERMTAALRLRAAREEEAVAYDRCYAIDTISAADLGRAADGARTGLSDRALDALLADRLVLVGLDLDAAPDRTASPVHGTAPAVMLHAAALENLISDGTQRPREPPLWLGISAAIPIGLLLVAFTAIPVHLVVGRAVPTMRRLKVRQRGAWKGALLVAAALGTTPWLAVAAVAPKSLAGILVFAALAATASLACLVRLPLQRNSRLLPIAAGIGGAFLPLGLSAGLFFWTHWAPANWISALTAKVSMAGDAAHGIDELLSDMIERRPAWLGPAGTGAVFFGVALIFVWLWKGGTAGGFAGTVFAAIEASFGTALDILVHVAGLAAATAMILSLQMLFLAVIVRSLTLPRRNS
jgi:hypothetical protein